MKRLLFIFASIVMCSSCATIISGSTQSVMFVSNPTGATVYDNGFAVGRTPLMAQLERRESHLITIELAGYEPFQIMLRRELNAWYLGNLILGPGCLVGLIIDPITGAMYSLSPDYIGVDMRGAETGDANEQPAQPIPTKQSGGDSDELILDIVLVPVAADVAGYTLIGQMVRK